MRKIKTDRGKAIDDWIKLQDLIPVNLRICQITAFDTEIIHSGMRSPIVIPTIPTEHSDVTNMWQEFQLPDMRRMLHEVAKKITFWQKVAGSADLDNSRTKKVRGKRIAALQI